MSQLFVKDQNGEWAVLRLEQDELLLTRDPPRRIADPKKIAAVRSQVLLTPGPGGRWLLTWGAEKDVRLNGVPHRLGLRLLEHRDEVRVDGGGTVCFSSEKRPEVNVFPGSEQVVACPRCRSAVEKGDRAVRCPGCDIWYHAKTDRGCWGYASQCAHCGNTTDLDAELTWTPPGV